MTACTSSHVANRELRVSVKDQKLAVYEGGQPVRVYGISTSKFGLGDSQNSFKTPLGKLQVAKKIGSGRAPGTVFKCRTPTGEILRPGVCSQRDPVVTRIMWLSGAEGKTRNAFNRFIYIHGTPQEQLIGTPASYGCIRMRSMDVIDLYNRIGVGTPVKVERGGLSNAARHIQEYAYTPVVRPSFKPSGKPPGESGSALVKR